MPARHLMCRHADSITSVEIGRFMSVVRGKTRAEPLDLGSAAIVSIAAFETGCGFLLPPLRS